MGREVLAVGGDQRHQMSPGAVAEDRQPGRIAAVAGGVVGDPGDRGGDILDVIGVTHAPGLEAIVVGRQTVVDAHQEVAGLVEERDLVGHAVGLVADRPGPAVDPDHHRRGATGARRVQVQGLERRRHARQRLVRDVAHRLRRGARRVKSGRVDAGPSATAAAEREAHHRGHREHAACDRRRHAGSDPARGRQVRPRA
jgi:hypothetical protein